MTNESTPHHGRWTSQEIFCALVEQPWDIEVTFSLNNRESSKSSTGLTWVASPHPSANNLQKNYALGLSSNDTKRLLPLSPSSHWQAQDGVGLVATSTVTRLSANSAIRTIELFLEPTHDSVNMAATPAESPATLSSSPHPILSEISLESLKAGTNISLYGKSVFANGYQSWSTSYTGADESTILEKPNWLYHELTKLGLASDMHIYDYTGTKGMVHSNLVTVIRDQCEDLTVPKDTRHLNPVENGPGIAPESLLLAGSLSEDIAYTYFNMHFGADKMSMWQDWRGKKLSSSTDRLVMKTLFCWDTKDTSAWDKFASVWATQHGDHRSTLYRPNTLLNGWTSWYCHYENINEHVILENLRNLSGYPQEQTKWLVRVFQIDDGYTVVGDWLDCDRSKFPRGMEFIANEIRQQKLVPGLWLAPFMASRKSKLVKEHPDWFVRKSWLDRSTPGSSSFSNTGIISNMDVKATEKNKPRRSSMLCCFDKDPFGDQENDLMLSHPAFHAGAYALDLENPEVRQHLANVFRVVTQEWGYKMLKLDFLFAAAQVPRNNKTRGQLMWEAMQMVRTWAGPETILLGCGVPLGPSFMVMDYCRIGCDVGASWDTMQRFFHDREYISCFNSLTSTLSRWALSDRFFGNDPDVFFIRDWNMGLSKVEKSTLMVLNHLLGRLVFCSDPMDVNHMIEEQRIMLNAFYQDSLSDDHGEPQPLHEVVRVLQPISSQKNIYLIQIKAQEQTFIVATNLSSKKHAVHLSVLDRIIAAENQETRLPTGQAASVYYSSQTGQFGSSAAAFVLKAHETCVFVRVVDSSGGLCGLLPSQAGQAFITNEKLRERDDTEEIRVVASAGGYILPTLEIKTFEKTLDSTLGAKYRIGLKNARFPRQVSVWIARKKVSSTVSTGSEPSGLMSSFERSVLPMHIRVNGMDLKPQLCPLIGKDIQLFLCTI